jgi:hypothetical protein
MAGRRHFGSVRKRSSGRWQASYFHLGTRHQAPETFATKAEALGWLAGVEVDIHRGGWVDEKGGRRLFADVANTWLDSRPDLASRSVLVYKSLLKCHLIPAFGHLRIAEISPSLIRTWHARLLSAVWDGFCAVRYPAGLSPGGAKNSTAMLSGSLHIEPLHEPLTGRFDLQQ